MKLKDLPKNTVLDGIKIKEGYIVSAWSKGFWVVDDLAKYKNGGSKVNPVFFENWDEAKEFEILT